MHSFRFKQALVMMFVLGGLSQPVIGKDATTRDSEPKSIVRLEKADNPRTVQVVYQSTTVQPVTIRVVDAQGYSLYSVKLKDEVNFRKAISFSEVPDGTYFIEVSGEGVNFRQPVTIDAPEASSLEAVIYPYPVVGRWILVVPGEEEVNVEITNQKAEVIFSELVKLDQESHGRVLDLRQVNDNNLTVRVSNGSSVVMKTIALK